MTLLVRAVASVACVAFLSLASRAGAHDAPSGWSYAPECCSNRDCQQISDTDVSMVPGGWRIKATGEVIAQTQARQSRDGHFHRCSAEGRIETRTLCLYVPDFGM
jgi:hypothetical protein